MQMKRAVLAAGAGAAVLFGSTAETHAMFTDTGEEEVEVLAERDIVSGYEDGSFLPDHDVTRAEAATMIGRSLGMDESAGDAPFTDVPEDHFAEGYIAAAAAADIINGYDDGTFQPDETLSRGEMAAILHRSYQLDDWDDLSFSDVPADHPFYEDITSLADSGITDGYTDGTFRPDNDITRLEFSLMVTRAMFPFYRPVEEPTDDIEEPDLEDPDYDPDTGSVDTEEAIGAGEVVNNSTLNVRAEDSADGEQVGQLTEGEEVAVHERIGNWARVSTEDVEGYVSHAYLMVDYHDHDSPLLGETIVVDPGHGGEDGGAEANGLVEKDLVLDVSLLLELNLQEAGANVIMTRRSDWYPSLSERVNQANNADADAFISVHSNAAEAETARGTETFYDSTYWAGDSEAFADTLQEEMLEEFGTVDRGVQERAFQVIRDTEMPGTLVEFGFKTNSEDAEMMRDEAFPSDAAEALYRGTVDFMESR
ncbi:N-acetylmuramoyl-L-alanine amidase [Alkalicoccus chagannorensis]|uniref:N-acetylmuramoyl-L-alanine amidase n=1 Tax=Alkalicoccus chagannorensis TaxID=427072 RepID=UPI00041DAFC1|nr:N-acetylmuramoyl-L-alanine amidase [Alkalicoccus chagannorensis]